MESFSPVNVLGLCEQLVNMSQTTLIMYIYFFTSPQDTTKVDATYHQLLDVIHKNVTKTKMKPHMH